MVPPGIRLYGWGAIALGAVGIVWGDFALQWQPVAPWIPGRAVLAYLFGAALVIAGACLNDFNPSKISAAAWRLEQRRWWGCTVPSWYSCTAR